LVTGSSSVFEWLPGLWGCGNWWIKGYAEWGQVDGVFGTKAPDVPDQLRFSLYTSVSYFVKSGSWMNWIPRCFSSRFCCWFPGRPCTLSSLSGQLALPHFSWWTHEIAPSHMCPKLFQDLALQTSMLTQDGIGLQTIALRRW
jgi:hypothetical protein